MCILYIRERKRGRTETKENNYEKFKREVDGKEERVSSISFFICIRLSRPLSLSLSFSLCRWTENPICSKLFFQVLSSSCPDPFHWVTYHFSVRYCFNSFSNLSLFDFISIFGLVYSYIPFVCFFNDYYGWSVFNRLISISFFFTAHTILLYCLNSFVQCCIRMSDYIHVRFLRFVQPCEAI